MHVRLCRDCGEEYRLDAPVDTCADCGGPIESRDVSAPDRRGDPARGDTADGGAAEPQAHVPYRLVVSTQSAVEMEPLAECLRAAEIPFAVRGSVQRFELWVPAPEAVRAREQLTKSPDIEAADVAAQEIAPDPSEPTTMRCPACETEVPRGVADCPECGLAVGDVEPDPCGRCGAPRNAGEDVACPACGHWEA